MKAHFLWAALLLTSQSPAYSAVVDLVGGPGQVDSDSTNTILTFAPMQWVYTSPSFGTDVIRITRMAMRFDQIYSRQNFPGVLDWTTDGSFYLRLGVVSGMGSNVQADNRNQTLTTVLAGSKTMPISVGADANQTKPWTIIFDFDTPFDYDPTLGNLIVDANIVRGPEIPGRPGSYYTLTADAIFPSSYGRGIAPASATNNSSYNIPVAQFTFSAVPIMPGGVPEPASWAMMILGLGIVGGAQRRRAGQFATA